VDRNFIEVAAFFLQPEMPSMNDMISSSSKIGYVTMLGSAGMLSRGRLD
jgi:hypothetical protein